MKQTYPILGILTVGLMMEPVVAAEQPELETREDKISYSIGINIGNSWTKQGVEFDTLNLEAIQRGIETAMQGEEPQLPESEMRSLLMSFQQEIRNKQEASRKEEATVNLEKANKFLAENQEKPGVKALESGLQYEVLKEGTGKSPSGNDQVVVHYRGTLIDGTVFDSSYERGQPATFAVNRVISGWTEGLQKMKEGAKWKLFIPPDLAYGERGTRTIGPNEALIFEVELLEVKEKEKPKPVTSDIIKVPSAEELKKGAKIEVLKPEDVERLKKEAEEKKKKEEPENQ